MSRFALALLVFAGVAQAKEVWLSAGGTAGVGWRNTFGLPAVLVLPGQQLNLFAKLGNPDRIVIDTIDDPIGNAFFWDSGTNLDITVDLGSFKLVSVPESKVIVYTTNNGPSLNNLDNDPTYGFLIYLTNLLPVIVIPPLDPATPIYFSQTPNAYIGMEFYTYQLPATDFPLGSFNGVGSLWGEAEIMGRAPWEGQNNLNQPIFGINRITTVNFANVPEASSLVLVGTILLLMATRALSFHWSN